MKNMKKQLMELLSIHGVSGKETKVRDYLKPVLSELMDMVVVDSYGNLLGETIIGTGEGATIMLSAHMDTVKGVLADRKLISKDGIISSDKGALGADDRAGIAIVLSVLRNITKTSFNGTIKVAFSREEEIGCVGSDKIDSNWYKDVDLAIVVDRRGSRDIVVGCGMAFCSNPVGLFMEDVAMLTGMKDWKCVEGGVSDAMTFAQKGINSINLSAGYYHEHSDREYVNVYQMKDTIRLIMQVFAVVNDFVVSFEEVPYENRWVKAWTKSYDQYGYSAYGYKAFDSDVSNDVWAEEYDQNGDVYIYELGKDVVIQQGDQTITLSRPSLVSLLEQLDGVK